MTEIITREILEDLRKEDLVEICLTQIDVIDTQNKIIDQYGFTTSAMADAIAAVSEVYSDQRK
jgi:hypothetical protein